MVNDINGFRQYKYLLKKLKRQVRLVSKSKKNNINSIENIYKNYINLALNHLKKVYLQLSILESASIIIHQKEIFKKYNGYAGILIDQINSRIIKGEKIDHKEKIFSIYEPYTEWISKGKFGVPVEFGLKVTVVKDQYQFILHHDIMEKKQDVHVAVQVADAVSQKYGAIDSVSFDRGYWSVENEAELNKRIRKVVMPKKGYCNQERQIIENEKEFKKIRNKHSAVESTINALQVHGLQKVPDRGIYGYKRYISLGIIGYNIHRLGSILLQKQNKLKKTAA
jgi:hypothetical protein